MTAVASYLDAKANGGEWLVRIEDSDTVRRQAGAEDSILRDLEQFGFEWDGPVWRQSRRAEVYVEALERLKRAGLVYPCACSRKEVADSATQSGERAGQRYSGRCAGGLPEGRSPRSWRIRVESTMVCFDDRRQGRQCQNVAEEVGDFVLLRADGLFAYQLAVVVDDAAQGISDVVRGADLLDSTQRQIYLQRALGLTTPRHLHVPVVTGPGGSKLSKQTGAAPLDCAKAPGQLVAALRFLGQSPPEELGSATRAEIWSWAMGAWSAESIPAGASLAASPAVQ